MPWLWFPSLAWRLLGNGGTCFSSALFRLDEGFGVQSLEFRPVFKTLLSRGQEPLFAGQVESPAVARPAL